VITSCSTSHGEHHGSQIAVLYTGFCFVLAGLLRTAISDKAIDRESVCDPFPSTCAGCTGYSPDYRCRIDMVRNAKDAQFIELMSKKRTILSSGVVGF